MTVQAIPLLVAADRIESAMMRSDGGLHGGCLAVVAVLRDQVERARRLGWVLYVESAEVRLAEDPGFLRYQANLFEELVVVLVRGLPPVTSVTTQVVKCGCLEARLSALPGVRVGPAPASVLSSRRGVSAVESVGSGSLYQGSSASSEASELLVEEPRGRSRVLRSELAERLATWEAASRESSVLGRRPVPVSSVAEWSANAERYRAGSGVFAPLGRRRRERAGVAQELPAREPVCVVAPVEVPARSDSAARLRAEVAVLQGMLQRRQQSEDAFRRVPAAGATSVVTEARQSLGRHGRLVEYRGGRRGAGAGLRVPAGRAVQVARARRAMRWFLT